MREHLRGPAADEIPLLEGGESPTYHRTEANHCARLGKEAGSVVTTDPEFGGSPERRHGMTWAIDQEICINCGRCIESCPIGALGRAGNKIALLDSDGCTGCGICADQCPVKAIRIEHGGQGLATPDGGTGLAELRDLARALVETLKLESAPVAVRLLRDGDGIPDGVRLAPEPLRHCQAIDRGSRGEVWWLDVAHQACFAARAALGMAPFPEKVANGQVPFEHGLAISQEVAARIMAEIPKLPQGTVVGEIVGALDRFPIAPEVVILKATPFQAMWVANALLFDSGGPRASATFAGMQASCADVTTVPILSGRMNVSPGCYGCRSAGGLRPEQMYVGLPYFLLSGVVTNLNGLRKAMQKFR